MSTKTSEPSHPCGLYAKTNIQREKYNPIHKNEIRKHPQTHSMNEHRNHQAVTESTSDSPAEQSVLEISRFVKLKSALPLTACSYDNVQLKINMKQYIYIYFIIYRIPCTNEIGSILIAC